MHIYKLVISSIHVIRLNQKPIYIIICKHETIRVDQNTTVRTKTIAAFVIEKNQKKKNHILKIYFNLIDELKQNCAL